MQNFLLSSTFMLSLTSAEVGRCDQSLNLRHILLPDLILTSGKKGQKHYKQTLEYDENWTQHFYCYSYRKSKKKKKKNIIWIT